MISEQDTLIVKTGIMLLVRIQLEDTPGENKWRSSQDLLKIGMDLFSVAITT